MIALAAVCHNADHDVVVRDEPPIVSGAWTPLRSRDLGLLAAARSPRDWQTVRWQFAVITERTAEADREPSHPLLNIMSIIGFSGDAPARTTGQVSTTVQS
jgi:hypothetical protein